MKYRHLKESDIESYRVEISENERIHFPYQYEEAFFDALSQGNMEEVFRLKDTLQTFSYGVMSRSQTKQVEYLAVILVSLTSRAAIRAGLDPYYAYDLNDLYLQKISEIDDPEQYMQIIDEALVAFGKVIRDVLAVPAAPAYVRQIKQYIGMHLNQDLSLTTLAAGIGLSPTYLSAIFKENEGIGLKEYIIRQRIEAARQLLVSTDSPISEIAAYVGFCSQSHFGKMFKQHTGMSPLVYRNSIR